MAEKNKLRVNLDRPAQKLNAHECLQVHQGKEQDALTISFKRTIRVVSFPPCFLLIQQKADLLAA
jgi:hypothetical protein